MPEFFVISLYSYTSPVYLQIQSTGSGKSRLKSQMIKQQKLA